MKGTVTWWNCNRGWGFATTAELGDVFIHHAALEDGTANLVRGEVLSLDAIPGTVGTVGANIRRVGE